MGIGHNLKTKNKASELGFLKGSMVPNPLLSAVFFNKMPAANLFFFFKGREDTDIKRKHQVNILLPF